MNEIIKASKVILTTEPGVEQIAMNEIQLTNITFKFLEWIASGVALIELENEFNTLASAFKITPPIFIRHICPVHISFGLNENVIDTIKNEIGVIVTNKNENNVLETLQNENNVLDIIEKEINKIIELLSSNKSFSVQTRFYGNEERNYKRYDINQRISAFLIKKGFILDVKDPEQVVSIVISSTTIFIGISLAIDNLSDWGGGSQRFLRDEGLISRAEFKLLEAIDVFKLEIPIGGKALDLGAAPGGWTRVLRKFNIRVTSVDPAKLHPSILADSGVTHIKQLAQNYLKSQEQYDVIVNDIRMDAFESAQIMGLASSCLNKTGIAVMTLKLPSKGMQKKTYQAIEILKQWYHIIGARQLFHNRFEVTVIMKLKTLS